MLNSIEKLTDEEMIQMFKLVKRYVETEMDQFENWKFDSKYGKVYLSIAISVSKEAEDAFLMFRTFLINLKISVFIFISE